MFFFLSFLLPQLLGQILCLSCDYRKSKCLLLKKRKSVILQNNKKKKNVLIILTGDRQDMKGARAGTPASPFGVCWSFNVYCVCQALEKKLLLPFDARNNSRASLPTTALHPAGQEVRVYMPLQGGDTGSKPSQCVSSLTDSHRLRASATCYNC